MFTCVDCENVFDWDECDENKAVPMCKGCAGVSG